MKALVAVMFAVSLAWTAAAEAGGVRVNVGRPLPHRGVIVQDRGLEVFGERRITVVQKQNPCFNIAGQWQCGGAPPPQREHRHQHLRPIIVPVVPGNTCYAPGYWTTHWVPQTSLYTVWVDGYVAPDGSWIDGRYEYRSYVSGYTQQSVWIPERWGC